MSNRPTLEIKIEKTDKELIFDEFLETIREIREDYPFINSSQFVAIILELKSMHDFVGQLCIEEIKESYEIIIELLQKVESMYSSIISMQTKKTFRYENYLPSSFEEFTNLTLLKYKKLAQEAKEEKEEKLQLELLSQEETITEELISKTQEMRKSIFETLGIESTFFLDFINFIRGQNNKKQ